MEKGDVVIFNGNSNEYFTKDVVYIIQDILPSDRYLINTNFSDKSIEFVCGNFKHLFVGIFKYIRRNKIKELLN